MLGQRTKRAAVNVFLLCSQKRNRTFGRSGKRLEMRMKGTASAYFRATSKFTGGKHRANKKKKEI